MGICLCTHAQAQAFARQKINARYRHDELLTTKELAIMISDVATGFRSKAATYIMKEHQRRVNSPTSVVSVLNASSSSNEFSSRNKGRRVTNMYPAHRAHVVQYVKSSDVSPAVATVHDT
jgi:hypothetical protein